MDTLPSTAELGHMLSERLLNRVQIVLCEAEVLANAGRPMGAVQLENGLPSTPNPMHMCRPMIVRINDNTEAGKPQNGTHLFSIPTQALRLPKHSPPTARPRAPTTR